MQAIVIRPRMRRTFTLAPPGSGILHLCEPDRTFPGKHGFVPPVRRLRLLPDGILADFKHVLRIIRRRAAGFNAPAPPSCAQSAAALRPQSFLFIGVRVEVC